MPTHIVNLHLGESPALTQTLRKLERDGLVVRTVIASVPPRVDYELTPLGHSLLPVQRAIKIWAETHTDAIHSARARYDGDNGPDAAGDDRPGGPPA